MSNFQDFYTQLLEQYQSVSYGDVLFGNIILVPLAQKHNTQYRKTLWSEYMGVVQIFNVTAEQVIKIKYKYIFSDNNNSIYFICSVCAISVCFLILLKKIFLYWSVIEDLFSEILLGKIQYYLRLLIIMLKNSWPGDEEIEFIIEKYLFI